MTLEKVQLQSTNIENPLNFKVGSTLKYCLQLKKNFESVEEKSGKNKENSSLK